MNLVIYDIHALQVEEGLDDDLVVADMFAGAILLRGQRDTCLGEV